MTHTTLHATSHHPHTRPGLYQRVTTSATSMQTLPHKPHTMAWKYRRNSHTWIQFAKKLIQVLSLITQLRSLKIISKPYEKSKHTKKSISLFNFRNRNHFIREENNHQVSVINGQVNPQWAEDRMAPPPPPPLLNFSFMPEAASNKSVWAHCEYLLEPTSLNNKIVSRQTDMTNFHWFLLRIQC